MSLLCVVRCQLWWKNTSERGTEGPNFIKNIQLQSLLSSSVQVIHYHFLIRILIAILHYNWSRRRSPPYFPPSRYPYLLDGGIWKVVSEDVFSNGTDSTSQSWYQEKGREKCSSREHEAQPHLGKCKNMLDVTSSIYFISLNFRNKNKLH